MPEFKNKEEYEKWKAQRIKELSEGKRPQEETKQTAGDRIGEIVYDFLFHGKGMKEILIVIAVIILVLLILLTMFRSELETISPRLKEIRIEREAEQEIRQRDWEAQRLLKLREACLRGDKKACEKYFKE